MQSDHHRRIDQSLGWIVDHLQFDPVVAFELPRRLGRVGKKVRVSVASCQIEHLLHNPIVSQGRRSDTSKNNIICYIW